MSQKFQVLGNLCRRIFTAPSDLSQGLGRPGLMEGVVKCIFSMFSDNFHGVLVMLKYLHKP